MTTESPPESDFLSAFRGRFVGVLRWEQLDALWATVLAQAEKGWYIYHVGEPIPTEPLRSEQMRRILEELNALLHQEHEYDYCGIVYADNLATPRFIKIFDPNHLGSSCGSFGTPILPGWILSRIAPVDLPTALPPANNRRRWWQRLFA